MCVYQQVIRTIIAYNPIQTYNEIQQVIPA